MGGWKQSSFPSTDLICFETLNVYVLRPPQERCFFVNATVILLRERINELRHDVPNSVSEDGAAYS